MKNLASIPLLAALLAAFLTGCASLGSEDETENWTVEQLYDAAHQAVLDENWNQAVDYFEKLEARFPFGPYAEQAQIEIAYAYYKAGEPDAALAAIDRFVRLHPRHPNVAYAYYLRGLVNFNRKSFIVELLTPGAQVQRDPASRRQAFFDFAELLRRFPDSRYAADARQRMVALRNDLATYEVQVGDYYMRRKAYVAAANRARYVIEHYDQAPAVIDALRLLAAAYDAMGLEDLARDTRRVLDYNLSTGATGQPAGSGAAGSATAPAG